MIDATALLSVLGRQTLVLTAAVLLLFALRAVLLRRFGASVVYMGWLLLPLTLTIALLPASKPAQALRTAVVHTIGPLLTSAPTPIAVPPSSWLPMVLAATWALGAALVAMRMLWLQRRFMAGLRLDADARHWQGAAGSGPALVGLLRPRLCLPSDFEQRFSASEQDLVLAHEQVHLARHDNRWNTLGALLCVLHWFNPFAWAALRRMRADQELACDAAVLRRHPDCKSAYAQALLEAQGAAPASALPWSNWQSTHPLIERIEMLPLHTAQAGRRSAGKLLLVALGLASVGLVHALQTEEDKLSAATMLVAMKLELFHPEGNTSSRINAQPSLRMVPGEWGSVWIGGSPDKPRPDQIAIEVRVTDLGGERLQVETRLRRGDPLQTFSEPRMIVENGKRGRIEVGDRGRPEIKLEITASRVAPGSKL
jgi:beta-lactamase regulating signal transducer with metallopeptidase domain